MHSIMCPWLFALSHEPVQHPSRKTSGSFVENSNEALVISRSHENLVTRRTLHNHRIRRHHRTWRVSVRKNEVFVVSDNKRALWRVKLAHNVHREQVRAVVRDCEDGGAGSVVVTAIQVDFAEYYRVSRIVSLVFEGVGCKPGPVVG